MSSLSCRISCLTGTSEYVFRLRRQCVGQLGLLIEFFLYVVLIFLRFRGRFFGYCRETSVTSPTCLPPYCLFHLLEWSDILSSCRVSSPLLRACTPPPHTLPLLSFPPSLSLSECLLANVSLFSSAQSPRSPDTESASCRVSAAVRPV